MTRSLAGFFFLLLTAPLWGLLFFVELASFPSFERWGESFAFSFKQAIFSSVSSLVIGFIFACALLACENKRTYQILRSLSLAFAAFPSLIWISSFFWWSSVLEIVPRGLGAIIFVHTLMNVGLVALGLELILRSRLGRLNEVAHVMGVAPIRFWQKVAIPLVWREALLLALVVFGFCFTSLAVPMIFSTPKDLTLEVLIYQLGVREGLWGQALILSMLQWLCVALLGLSLGWFQLPLTQKDSSWAWLVKKELKLVYIIPVLFLATAYAQLFLEFFNIKFWTDFVKIFSLSALLGSLATGLLVSLLLILMLLGISLIGPQDIFKKFLRGYAAPSMAIVGVFLYLLPGHSVLSDLLKLSVGLSLLFLPGLYRWMGESHFESLRSQWVQARVLGANPLMIAQKIWWPQSLEIISWVSGLGALWAVSDFALSSMLLQRPYSLALIASESFNSYRIQMGMAYTLVCLAVGLGIFLFIRKCLYVRN